MRARACRRGSSGRGACRGRAAAARPAGGRGAAVRRGRRASRAPDSGSLSRIRRLTSKLLSSSFSATVPRARSGYEQALRFASNANQTSGRSARRRELGRLGTRPDAPAGFWMSERLRRTGYHKTSGRGSGRLILDCFVVFDPSRARS